MEKTTGNGDSSTPDDEPVISGAGDHSTGSPSSFSRSGQATVTTQRNIAILTNAAEVPRTSTRGLFWDLLFEQLERRVETHSEEIEFHEVSTQDEESVLSEELRHKIDSRQIHGLIGIALSD